MADQDTRIKAGDVVYYDNPVTQRTERHVVAQCREVPVPGGRHGCNRIVYTVSGESIMAHHLRHMRQAGSASHLRRSSDRELARSGHA